MNYLHDLAPGTADEMHVIIESPKSSPNKYEIDKETGLIKLDRANYSAAAFPADYGFIPQTLWEDGDAIDVVVITTFPLFPGILVKVRPVALMEMIDTGESDYKIIGVPTEDKRWDDVNDLGDLNQHTLKEIKHFFETYKVLKDEKSKVVINGFKPKGDAVAAFNHGIELYQKEFKK